MTGRISGLIRIGIIAASGLISTAAASAQPTTSVSIDNDGKVAVSQAASDPAPLACIGPGTQIRFHFSVVNNALISEDVSLNAALDTGLADNDGCTATLGTCAVPDPSTVTWTVTVPPLQTGALTYPVNVAFGTPANTTLCVTYSFSLGQLPPIIIPACLTTTTAGSCGLGAPALGGGVLALLIGILALGGFVSLRRRRA